MFKQEVCRAQVLRTRGSNSADIAVVDENGNRTGEKLRIEALQMSSVRAALWWPVPILDRAPTNQWVPQVGEYIRFTQDGSPFEPEGPKLRWCLEDTWQGDLEEIARRNTELRFRLAFLSGGEYVCTVWETTQMRPLAEQLLGLSREFRRTGDEHDFLTRAAKNGRQHTGLQIQIYMLRWGCASEEVRAPYYLINP